MVRALILLCCVELCGSVSAMAEDANVTIRFLGGAKKVPLDGLKVTIRQYTGDWSADRLKILTNSKTGKSGEASFHLADGRYYVDIQSEKEIPYLDRPVGFKSPPSIYDRMIKVGEKRSFEFNLADACRLTMRAVDVDTGKGVPGAVFATENALAEDWAHEINGDNLGHKQGTMEWTDPALKTDKDGNYTRLIGPRHGYTYFLWIEPPGYERAEKYEEITLESPVGTEKVEHVFKLRKKAPPPK